MAIHKIQVKVREKGFWPCVWAFFSSFWECEVKNDSYEPEIVARILRVLEKEFGDDMLIKGAKHGTACTR